MNDNRQSPQLPLKIEGACTSPDWSKAISFAPEQPPVLPMICQDKDTAQVLMLGYVTEETLTETLNSGLAVFWSRSRASRWQKGETSGNVLRISRILTDCDADCLLAMVEPQGPACHRNSVTCFDGQQTQGEFSETDVGWSALARLQRTLESRAGGADPESYTYKLMNAGIDRVLRKLGEECTETILAAKNSTITGSADEFLSESADLLYHWLVAVNALKRHPAEILEVLRSREGGPRRVPAQKI
jgi:phosphoribosyl-ATP pyrophosphohydrolase/phosphoribosyl-AMP cyclohydrolase